MWVIGGKIVYVAKIRQLLNTFMVSDNTSYMSKTH